MRHAILCIALGAMLLGSGNAHAASSYTGTWSFSLKVAQTDCKDVAANSAFDLVFTQATKGNKKVLAAVSSSSLPGAAVADYRGYTTKSGILMSLGDSCQATTPPPKCTTGTESFSFLDSSKSSTKVLWISITRNDNSEFTCSTVFTGTAKKKKVKGNK